MNIRAPFPSYSLETFDFSVVNGIGALAARSVLECKAKDPRAVVNGDVICEILDCSPSQRDKLRTAEEIPSFTDGARRKYPPGGGYDYLIRKIIESNPAGAEPLKVRNPVGQFKPGHKPRPKTRAQMEAFEKANALRIRRARERREAEARRAAKQAAVETA